MENNISMGDIEVNVRISQKAKNIILRINPAKIVELIIPRAADFNRAKNFLAQKELWIRNKLRTIKAPANNDAATKIIPIFGEDYELILNDINVTEPIKFDGKQILVSNVIAASKVNSILIHSLKKMVKEEIIRYASLKSLELNVIYKNITIKDTTSRWGSCSSQGNLSFSWRLILAPREVLEYVVIHELCHLKEMNHSHKFWKLVNDAFPKHHEARLWLKRNGKNLHSFL